VLMRRGCQLAAKGEQYHPSPGNLTRFKAAPQEITWSNTVLTSFS